MKEADNLYNKLTTELTNMVIAASKAMMISSLPTANNWQKIDR